MEKIEYLRLAHELFGPVDLPKLLETANALKDYIEKGNVLSDVLREKHILELTDVKEFAKHCSIQHPINGNTKLNPYPFQEKVLDFLHKGAKVTVVNQSRQMGMSTLAAIYGFHYALMNKQSTVVFIIPKFSQGEELMHKLRFMYEDLRSELYGVTEYNKTNIAFDNGSKIIIRSASGDALRGLSTDLIIMADVAFYSYSKDEDLWNAILPTLSSGGRLIMHSTPNKDQGLFYKLWSAPATDNLSRLKITWRDHPERDQVWADTQRKQLGETKFRSEFEGEFITSDPVFTLGL